LIDEHLILVVEDDDSVRNLICTALSVEGYHFRAARNGATALALATSENPRVILLDLGLPDKDGIEIIETIRSWSHAAILVISARNEDRDKIEALDAGADDYLTKPFSVDELLARLRATFRRLASAGERSGETMTVFTNGELMIDYSSRCVYLSGKETHLTPIEYNLLCLLARNCGKVLTHTYILKEIWGGSYEGDIMSLRVFMVSLRKKIEPEPRAPRYIQTHVGVGYRMLEVDDARSVLS